MWPQASCPTFQVPYCKIRILLTSQVDCGRLDYIVYMETFCKLASTVVMMIALI